MNKDNHPDTVLRQAKRNVKAVQFAHQMKAMNKGTQAEQSTRDTVIRSMMASGLTVREARKLYKAA